MLVFADLGNINLDVCIIYAIQKSKITPPSLFYHLRLSMEEEAESAKSNTVQRFSFLSNKVGILPAISLEDFTVVQKHSLVLDTRPIDQ